MRRCCMIIKGSLVRILFSLFAGICVWLISGKDARFWLLFVVFLLLIFMEGAYTLGVKKGGSWKWFSPTIALLLLCTVPCLWVVELDIYEIRRRCQLVNGKGVDCEFNKTSLPPIFGLNIPTVALPLTDWSLILHQILLFALILGRWLLPKGELTRDQLSQLLLVQIGMAADILEFVTEGVKVEEIYGDNMHVLLLLTVWTWSLPQFTLSLTLTKGRKKRVAGVVPLDVEPRKKRLVRLKGGKDHCHCFCGTEVWAILVTLAMQDLPFLATRLYIIFSPNIGMIFTIPFFFFTFKNLLLAMLQLYRLAAILHDFREKRKARAARAMNGESSWSEALKLGDKTASVRPKKANSSDDPNPKVVDKITTASVWFTTASILYGSSDKEQKLNLRHRKHASIQTESPGYFDDDIAALLPPTGHRQTDDCWSGESTALIENHTGTRNMSTRRVDAVGSSGSQNGHRNCAFVVDFFDDEEDERASDSGVHGGEIDVEDLGDPNTCGEGHLGEALNSDEEGEEIRRSICEIVANVDECHDCEKSQGEVGCCDNDSEKE